ncbi:hypothetical protein NDA16_002719 [Ustilago loliicola]|nr:hypothetical protein NDA16_002719 [Ustilago loliicola]
MSNLFNKYVRVPTSSSSSTTLPTSVSDTRSSPTTGFGRARTRWALIGGALFTLLLFFGFASSDSETSAMLKAKAGEYAHKLPWSPKPSIPSTLSSSVLNVDGNEFNRWLNGSGRTDLRYDSPFNPEDLTLTEDECDTFFPGLWKEIDRSVDYFTEHPLTAEYLDKVCDDGIWSHARVLIHNNRVYLKYFQQSAFTRVNSALALLFQSVVGSREKLPDAEFCLSANDWGSMGKFSLDRAPYLEDVWLMPDYGFYSWPEPGIGSYTEHREKTLRVEQANPWGKKVPKLFWRGAMGVGTADRKALLAAAENHAWNDVKPLDWGNREGFVTMEDHL